MTYKAIFLDVDGTTIVHGIDNLPSLRVTEAVRRAMDAGVYVGLATSRPPSSSMHVIDHLELNGSCVLSSGAQIYDPNAKKIIRENILPQSAVRPVLDAAASYNVEIRMYDGEKNYVYDGKSIPSKILGMYFPTLTPAVLQDITTSLEGVHGISFHRMEAWESGFECLDIVNDKTSKFYGVTEVSNLLDIPESQVVGIGDGYNDIPLFKACGMKVAMGNAVPELKKLSDIVVPTVENDGVAVAIEKFILS